MRGGIARFVGEDLLLKLLAGTLADVRGQGTPGAADFSQVSAKAANASHAFALRRSQHH